MTEANDTGGTQPVAPASLPETIGKTGNGLLRRNLREPGEPGSRSSVALPPRLMAQLRATWTAALIILLVTAGISAPLLFSAQQFVVADLQPYSAHLLQACAVPYEKVGLGRDNPSASPILCAIGAASGVMSGPLVQHIYLIGTLWIAGLGMFVLLRRLRNPWILSFIGAILYELSPAMLNQASGGGPGILLTGALLPAVLLGVAPPRNRRGWRSRRRRSIFALMRGAQTGITLAIACYANVQAPALVAFLLVPAIIVLLWIGRQDLKPVIHRLTEGLRPRKAAGNVGISGPFRSGSETPGVKELSVFVAGMVGVFVIAAVPVFQSLGGQVASLQSTSDSLLADLTRLLAQSNGYSDFFSPYLFVGAIPALIAMAIMGLRKDVHPLEIGLVGSFLALILFWEIFWHWGPTLVRAVPSLALFKDFIKLQIVMAVPLTVASITCLRWLSAAFKARSPKALVTLLIAMTLALVIGPEWITAGPAIRSGQLGLNAESKVPATYMQVFDRLHAIDSKSNGYRVLWIPMDFRVFRSFESLQPETLLYRDDSSADAKAAVLNTYQAIAGNQLETISSLLATEGVKYVVLDLVDGQKPGEPWQTGHKTVVNVFGTYLLTGSEMEYRAVLDNTPGLGLVIRDRYLVYQNLDWRPVLKSYAGILTVPAATQEARSVPSQGQGISLTWEGGIQGVHWRLQADRSVRIEAVNAPPGQSLWSPVSALIPVVGGASYRISGDMNYDQVFQSHAKIDWRSNEFGKDSTTFLVASHDGTGAASLGQVVVAPAGASFADIVLMGGWSQGLAGFTVFSGVTVQALTSPDLSALATHPDQLLSLWSELPNLLIEAGAQVQPQSLAAVNWLSLSEGRNGTSNPSSAVRLFTPSELTLTGKWGINAQPDRLGIEHFMNHGGGSITVPQGLLTSAPIGSQVVWTEYKPSDTEPSSGFTTSVAVSRDGVTLRCSTSNCTIANVMLVPPLIRKGKVARFAYAYSHLLRTPDGGRSPVRLAGDWASIYSPPPQADPSGLDDRSAIGRILGLAFGYFVIVASSLVLLIFRP